MVLQQCLACNSMKTDTRTSCACGHVFENSKQIGGKRFSEYRASLYYRLENRRMKRLTRENKKGQNEKQSQPLKEHVVTTNTTDDNGVIPRSSFKPKTHTSAGSKTFNRRIKNKTLPRGPSIDSASGKTCVPPELVSRLPNALQEINRRLTGQNLTWWTMHWLQ